MNLKSVPHIYWKIRQQIKIKVSIYPIPDDNILDWSKLKEIADDILKCI